MGADKSRLLLNGETFIERIARTLRKVATTVSVVGQQGEHAGLRNVDDVYQKWGALGGLHAALAACESEWAVVVACDLPFVTSDLFLHLTSLRFGFDAVVPLQNDGFPQPLCGLYRIEPCLMQADKLIRAGLRRPLDLLNSVNTRWLGFEEMQNLEHAEKFFVNINTPEDYDEMTRETGAIQN
jgi:molybdenum cofactor guanylyltransferase